VYLKYGSHAHASGECSVAIAKHGLFARSGIRRAVLVRWDIQGRLQAADASSLTGAINALEAAYQVPGQDIGLYFDDGTPTSHRIASAQTSGGVRIVVAPSFPQGRGAEYSTFRSYVLSIEAELPDTETSIIAWNEVLNFNGGGAQFGFFEPINGLPQKQLLRQATTFKVTQQGSALGNGSYPVPAVPIWPTAEHLHLRKITYELPSRKGSAGQYIDTEFPVSWSYVFESELPLTGAPTAWPE